MCRSRYLLFLLLLLLYNLCQSASYLSADAGVSSSLKCKYVFISKSFYGNSLSSQSLAKIIKLTKRPLELNEAYFKFYEDDCLNERRVDQIIQQQNDNDPFILFGIDLSYNQLNDSSLEQLLYNNPVLKFNINLVKYLDLRGNSLRWLNSSLTSYHSAQASIKSTVNDAGGEQLLDEELSYMNEVQLKSEDTFYLLNRFFNLELIVLDENELLSVDISNAIRIFQKLKVLSLNRCGLDKTVQDYTSKSSPSSDDHQHQLYYLGLSQNGLTESQTNKLLASLYASDSSLIIDNLDLSENRIKVIEELVVGKVNKLNLDKNLIGSFNVRNMANKMQARVDIDELSLRFNSIKDTSLDNFKLNSNVQWLKSLRVNLEGNPLVCDCKSQWLLDLVQTYQREASSQTASSNKQYLSRKKSSSKQQQQSNSIKLVYKRELKPTWWPVDSSLNTDNYEVKADTATTLNDNTEFVNMNKHNHHLQPHRRFKRAKEEISPHFSLESDPNLPPRQKRIKNKLSTATTSDTNAVDEFIQIADLDQLSCLFIDVQGFDSEHLKQQLNESTSSEDLSNSSPDEFDMSEAVDYVIVDEASEQPQNINANIRYLVEKKVIASQQSDYMCQYADHCDAKECDCCAFMHCHCRSICPSECRCYYDARRSQNIIDCSAKSLVDMPSTENPIESATDIRLDRNDMKSVKTHIFFGYGQVKYLYLQENEIENVEREAFEDLKLTLRLINLANNKLNFLDVWAEFSNFNELEVLVLSGNPLKQISSTNTLQLSILPKLKVIYASKTNLSESYLSQLVKQPFYSSALNLKYKVKTTTESTTTLITTTAETTTTQVISTTSTLSSTSRSTRPTRNSTRRSSKTSSRIYMTNWWLYTTTPSPSTRRSSSSFTDNQEKGSHKIILSTLSSTRKESTKSRSKGGFEFPTQKLAQYYQYIISGAIAFVLVASSVCLIVMICRLRKSKPLSGNSPASVYYMEPAENDEDDEGTTDDDDDDGDDGSEEAIERRHCRKKRYETTGKFNLATLFKTKNTSTASSTYTNIKRKRGDMPSIYGGAATGLRHNHHHRPPSTSSYASVDSATVPVSRSLDHLTLNVFVHFHLNDNQYIVDYLLPCLKLCTSMVPDTRFILKVQTEKYMDSFDYTMVLNQTNSSSSEHSHNGPDLVIIDNKKCSNSLVANLFVLSNNFEGYRSTHSSLSSSSLRTKSNTSSRISATNSTRSTNDSSGSGAGGFVSTNFSTRRAHNPTITYKNSFKIHLFKLTPSMLLVERQMATMNQANMSQHGPKSTSFLKKLYNTAGLRKNSHNNNNATTTTHHSSTDQNPYLSISSVNNSNLPLLSHTKQSAPPQTNYCLFAPNDLYNAYAYHEQLQYKIERYLEHVCLKSNMFSKSNFSYVDYTSKR